MIGKNIRLKHIFKDDNRAVVSALDFGAFTGTVKGLDKPRDIVQKVVSGGADALIMTPGFARAVWDIFAGKAGLILRVTGGCSKFNDDSSGHILTTSVREACLLGADAVCNMIFVGSSHEREMFQSMQVLSEECYKYGLVLFTELLRELRKDYDYIIIDTPPLGRVIDSAIIAEHCDGVVLVIEANAISYKLAQRVKNQLQKGNIRILGAILNKVEMNSINYKYYGRKYKKYDKDYYFK
jgi:hypothetical protein